MDEETLLAIHNAYATGQMTPEERAEYVSDVNAGLISLPQGATLDAQEETTQTSAFKLPEGVLDAYFTGQMTQKESQQLEQDAGQGLIKLPEGVTVTQFEAGGDPTTPDIGYKLEKDRTIGEQVVGVGEAALALGTGATGGTVGQVVGTLQGLVEAVRSGKYGTEEGARLVEKTAQDLVQSLTYEPRTEAGQEYTQAAAETLAPLEALGPLGAELEMAARGARVAPVRAKPSLEKAEAVAQTEAAGITPLTSDIRPPRTFAGKLGQAAGERIPVVGTGPVRAAQQEQRISAIKSYLTEQGAIGTENIIDDVMTGLSTARKEKIDKFTNLKKDVFSRMKDATVDTKGTVSAIDNELARLKGLKTEGVNPLVKILEDYKVAFKDQNIENIEALRKQLGDQLDAPDLTSVSTEAGKASRNIYKSLNDDIGNFVKENGEPKDYNKWKVANRQLSETIGELQNSTLKSVLRKGNASPEDVKKLLFSRKPSDIKLIYKNLNRDGRATARSAILHEAVQKAGGVEGFTPEKFRTKIKALENSTGIFFKGDEKKALDGLMKALELTKQASVAGVKPITGAELTLPVGAAVLTDLLGGAGAGIATAGGIGGMARLYESRPVRNAFIRLSNAPKSKQMPIYGALISAIQSQKEEE